MAKKRLDVAMVEQGLAESRQKAQAIIMAGQVYVNGQKLDKAGAPVTARMPPLRCGARPCAYVSRGGLKLEKAMQLLAHHAWKRLCLCRHRGLHRGLHRLHAAERDAEKVYAVDVGL